MLWNRAQRPTRLVAVAEPLTWADVNLEIAATAVRWQLSKDCRRRVPVKTEVGERTSALRLVGTPVAMRCAS